MPMADSHLQKDPTESHWIWGWVGRRAGLYDLETRKSLATTRLWSAI